MDSKSLLVPTKVQAFKNLRSQKLKCQLCGPNKLKCCHQHFSFQALECSFASSFRKNKKRCLYFVLTVILKVLQKKSLRGVL